MKAYCENCGTHEASFRPDNDAKTGEPFEDLCCDGCHLVLATVSEREGGYSERPDGGKGGQGGNERNFEVARLPARDEDGHVQHPDMDGIGWDEFDMGPQLRALGWASTTVCFESDASDEARDRYSDSNSPDCSYWTPTPPEGAGWLLAAIYDTEDGPVALYVRSADGVDLPDGAKR